MPSEKKGHGTKEVTVINVFSKLFRVCPKESSLEVTIPKPVAPET